MQNSQSVTEIVVFRLKPEYLENGLAAACKVPEEAAQHGHMLSHATLQAVNDPGLLCHQIVWASQADAEQAVAQFKSFPSAPALMQAMEKPESMNYFRQIAAGQP